MTPDAAQQQIVDADVDASGVVIGAPGTGKTTTLVARVARLIADGRLAPDEVLVLTPTRQAATALRDRIGVLLPVATPGALARSIGAFAFQLVRAATVVRGDEPPVLLTGAEQDRLLAGMLDPQEAPELAWPDELGPEVRASKAFRSELRVFLAECVEAGIAADELRASPEAAWRAMADFLVEYIGVVSATSRASRDAAELVAEAAAITRTAPAERIGPLARLKAVLVDDAQELTRGGIALVDALRERGVAVLAFGDPDISSGAFRGASPEHFAALAALLGDTWVLGTPHRQNPALAALTARLTQGIGATGRVEHRLRPGAADSAEAVTVFTAASPYEEADRIAGVLRDWHLSHGIRWDDMAVIAHDTRQIALLETELAAREVPTRAAGVPRPLGAETVVREIVEAVELGCVDPPERDPEIVGRVLGSTLGGFDAVSLRRLRAALRHHELAGGGSRSAKALLVEAMDARSGLLALIPGPEARAAERVAETLAQTHAGALAGESAHELLWRVWDRARDPQGRRLPAQWQQLAEQHRNPEVSHALDALVALFDAAKRFGERSPDEPASKFLHDIAGSDVPEDSLSAPERPGVVTLMTPASALGTEFEAVVIAGVQEGVWPNVRLRGSMLQTWRLVEATQAARAGTEQPAADAVDRRRDALYDELRLFVRASSRARTRLVVTAVSDDDHTPSGFLSFLPEPDASAAHPSAEHPLTLRGLVARHRRTLTTGEAPEPERAHAAEQLAVLAREGVPGADPAQWYGAMALSTMSPLVDMPREKVRVSPSKVESFEDCALDWVIAALGGAGGSTAASVGTLLHAAMEEVPAGGVGALTAAVEARWSELEFEADWLAAKERRRADLLIERLDRYLRQVRDDGGRLLASEPMFELEIDLDADGGPRVVSARVRGETGEVPAEPGHAHAVLSGAIDRVELYAADGGEQVRITDLKTGKAPKKYRDDHVADDPQLTAYQLAFHEGAVPGAGEARLAGSQLVLIGKDPLKNQYFRVAKQPPLDEQARRAFLERVAVVAREMAATSFLAQIETHCESESYAVCTIHTIGPVSAA